MPIHVEDDDSCLFFISPDSRPSASPHFSKKDIVYANIYIYIYMGNETKTGLDSNRIVTVFILGVTAREIGTVFKL